MAPSPSSIRFPAELREQIAETAAAQHRTFSGQVILFVESGLRACRRTQEQAQQAFLAELIETFDAEVIEP